MKQRQGDIIRIDDRKEETEIDLLELLLYFRGKLLLVITGCLAGAAIAGCITNYVIVPRYSATAKLYMVSSSSDSVVDLTDLNIGTSLSSDYEELIRTRPIIEGIIEDEGLDYTYEQLLKMISVSTISDTRILTITAESTVQEEAQVIANALADKAAGELPKLMDTSKPNIAERAIYPKEQSSPSLSRNTVLGAVLGTALVLGILTFVFVTDDTVRSAHDIERVFGIMPLAVVPEGDIAEVSDNWEKKRKKKKRKRRK